MLEFVRKRIEHHANIIIANKAIIDNLESSAQATRQAQNAVFMAGAAMAELNIIEQKITELLKP